MQLAVKKMSTKYLDNEGLSHFWGKIKNRISESVQTIAGEFSCETHEISSAVNEPAVLYATKMVFLDQTGYEMLESGNAPWGHYSSAYSGSHQSASFSTVIPSSTPYAVALSTGINEYALGYNLTPQFILILDWSYGSGAVKISDLLAAGEKGTKLTLTNTNYPYGDGTLDIYASFSANQDGSYTVSYSARKDAVTEDVLTAKIDGKDGSGAAVSSVDVSPLLNYIGGRVEEVPAGDLEMLPLVDPENPEVEPPSYFCFLDSLNFVNSGDLVYPDAGVFSDGVLTVSFSTSSPEPESFTPLFYYGDPSSKPSLAYTKLDSSTGQPAGFSLETALAGPLALDELDISSNQPVPTGNTASLVAARVEGDSLTYSFTLYSSSGETKKVLHLYPSCNNEIDLSPVISDTLTDAQLKYQSGQETLRINNASGIDIEFYDANNQQIGFRQQIHPENGRIEITLPDNCSYFKIIDYYEILDNNMMNFCNNNNIVNVENIRPGYVFKSEEMQVTPQWN